MFDLLFQPFVLLALGTAFVLAGIHTYLGFHVVQRGVIFVDLSMAQAAAFGTVVALTLGYEESEFMRYLISLGFTFVAAFLIAFSHFRDERIPQEALIGIFYAMFTMGAILLLSKRVEGGEELNHMLAGSLLTVQPQQLFKIFVLYSGIGLFHWRYREKIFAISLNRQSAQSKGVNVHWWDFLFYATFGLVVTSSVEVAGVMLVFALLVIPPVIASLFTQSVSKRLLMGWTIGFAGALFGVLFSLRYDFPVGPSIGIMLVFFLIIAFVVWEILKK